MNGSRVAGSDRASVPAMHPETGIATAALAALPAEVSQEASPADSALGRGVTSGGVLLAHDVEQAPALSAVGEAAWENHQAIVVERGNVEAGFLRLGRLLLASYRQGHYKAFAETWEAYIASPELAFRRSTVYRLLRTADVCDRLHIADGDAGDVGAVKMDLIRRPLLEGGDLAEWLEKAKVTAVRDLREEAREFLARKGAPDSGKLTVEDEHREEDRVVAARVEDALKGSGVARVTFGRFEGLTVALENGQVIRVWAKGGPLWAEVI